VRIIVTGGASGMGAGAVRGFAADGAEVVSCDLSEEPGRQIADEATATGPGRATFVQCDVAEEESVDAAFAHAVDVLGGLDVLVHAAGVAPGGPAAELDVAGWDRVLAVNARGTFLTNRAAHRVMAPRGGRIINFASAAGVNGYPGKAHYAASKGAVVAWTRTVAVEWASTGITVNAIAPAIWTPMYDRTRAAMSTDQLAAHDAQMAVRMPIGGRLGDIQRDLMPVLRFLAGEGSRFMTGQVFPVDGGMLMMR
jgi:NAD(P)-dependent dehydrogenase (short-subunit alcohol dehydrogenase family)